MSTECLNDLFLSRYIKFATLTSAKTNCYEESISPMVARHLIGTITAKFAARNSREFKESSRILNEIFCGAFVAYAQSLRESISALLQHSNKC